MDQEARAYLTYGSSDPRVNAAQRRSSTRTPGQPLAARLEMRLGEGRSGVVFRSADSEGRPVARKVFDSDTLTKAVQYVFLGAPNPYAWNEHAVQTALLRRRILAPLVEHWFAGELRVARAIGQDWNEEYRAYQLHTEFVAGEPPRLHNPFQRQVADELTHFRRVILEPLQRRLVESGFDGMVWQAGRGNPVALGNFLCERASGGEVRWAWIDLESGVPALFPLGVHELFRFYLPRSFHFRRPLFDDVDVPKLRGWIAREHAALEGRLGFDVLHQIESDVEALAYHQAEWKTLPRHERSIRYQWKKGSIDERTAEWFAAHRWRWYALESRRLAHKGLSALAQKAARGLRRALAIPWRRLARAACRFSSSQRYRRELAQRFIGRRIDSWQGRGQLDPRQAEELHALLARDEACAWLTDFGVHVGIKSIDKTLEFFVLPALYYFQVIDGTYFGVGFLFAGAVVRTFYTLGRLVQASMQGRERPWIALGVGVLPIVGNLAYPLQIAYSGAGRDDRIAQFLLYDGCSLIGAKLPIWGGRDTLTEHVFNHLPDRLLRASPRTAARV